VEEEGKRERPCSHLNYFFKKEKKKERRRGKRKDVA